MTIGVEAIGVDEVHTEGSVLITLRTPPSHGTDEPVSLSVNDLLPADSPRLQGENIEHIRALAELKDELPPILVHRKTMRVIDGMHRLKATILCGERTIKATFYDGDDAKAFVMAVKANIEHGLPLSCSDRKAAATRILRTNPQWSNRAIAQVSGLSAKTVGAIRGNSAEALSEVPPRIGRDGRVRPLSTVNGRRFASQLIALHPEASSREIARKAGISPSTVRDVRDRLCRGEDPVPIRRRGGNHAEPPTRERRLQKRIGTKHLQSFESREEILEKLSHDPAIRLTENGRAMLRWMSLQSQQVDKDWSLLTGHVPDHCTCLVADLACRIAESWLELASALRSRALL